MSEACTQRILRPAAQALAGNRAIQLAPLAAPAALAAAAAVVVALAGRLAVAVVAVVVVVEDLLVEELVEVVRLRDCVDRMRSRSLIRQHRLLIEYVSCCGVICRLS